MADVNVTFSAETGRYVANVQNAEKATAKAAETVAATKNKVLDYFNAQTEGAKKVGVSTQALEAIQKKAAETLANVTEANAKRISDSLDRLVEKQRRVAAELQNLPKLPPMVPPESSTSGHGFSDRMAASAVVRGAEAGRIGVRPIENLLTMIPGATAALQPLAMALGAAGIAGLLVDVGIKGAEAFDVTGERANRAREAIRAVTNELSQSSTSLDVQIDKLQQEQAKLEKKPFNGTKLALDEAAEAAQNLANKLDGVIKKEAEALKSMDASVPQRILTGGSTTKYEQTMLTEHGKWLDQANNPQDSLRESESFGRSLQTRLAELQSKQAANDALSLSTAGVAGSAFVSNYKEEIAAVQELLGWQGREHSNIQKTIDLQKQEGATQKARDAAGAAKIGEGDASRRLRALENMRDAEKQRGATDEMQRGLLGPQADKNFWSAALPAFAEGSNEHHAIVQKITQDDIELQKSQRETAEALRKRAIATQNMKPPADLAMTIQRPYEDSMKAQREMDRARDTNADASNEIAAIRARAAATEEETRINQAAGRTMTEQDAKRQIALLHVQQYNAQIEALNAKAQQVANASYLTPPEKASQLRSINEQGTNLEAQRQEAFTKAQILFEPMDTSAMVAAEDALNELTNAFNDSAKQLKDVIGGAISSINSSLITELTTRHQHGYHNSPFRAAGIDITRNFAGAGLQKVEGLGLGALGLGDKHKPSGRAGDALHTIIDNMPSLKIPGVPSGVSDIASKSLGGSPEANQQSLFSGLFPSLFPSKGNSASNALSAMAQLYPGGSTDDSASSAFAASAAAAPMVPVSDGALPGINQLYPSDANATPQFSTITPNNSTSNAIGSMVGKSAMDLLPLLGGFADGTDPISEGTMKVVGERGPEVEYLPKGAGVVPNNKLGDLMGGGGHSFTFHPGAIDARGSTDPAATEAAVHRGVQTAVTTSLQASAHRQAEDKRRRPALAQR